MNVALRAVHDALSVKGEPSAEWLSLIGQLTDRVAPNDPIDAPALRPVVQSVGCSGTASEWFANLRSLGVLRADGRLDTRRAASVATALDLAADSFSALGSVRSWAPVATVPDELRPLLRTPPLRQTAGVLLDLVDRAAHEIRLAAPFVDEDAVEFLAESLLGAGRRSVSVAVITSTSHGRHFVRLAQRWGADPSVRGRLRVSELRTHLSSLGSHAKIMVVDAEYGYVGSANLTAAGFGRHVEIGVELAGPQVAELTSVLAALERVGRATLTVGV